MRPIFVGTTTTPAGRRLFSNFFFLARCSLNPRLQLLVIHVILVIGTDGFWRGLVSVAQGGHVLSVRAYRIWFQPNGYP